MLDPTLADVVARLDELAKEIRRQGRAAVAAQAAAEQCLEVVEQERRDAGDDEAAPNDARAPSVSIAALVPIADALDRVVEQAASVPAREPRRRSVWDVLRGGDGSARDADAVALHEGLRVLRAQLQALFESAGVTVDRRTGDKLDAERHRVVEVRGQGAEEIVAEILRPGYRVGDVIIREADVVVERRRGVSAS